MSHVDRILLVLCNTEHLQAVSRAEKHSDGTNYGRLNCVSGFIVSQSWFIEFCALRKSCADGPPRNRILVEKIEKSPTCRKTI